MCHLTETNWIHLVLFSMQNRIFSPYLAAIIRISHVRYVTRVSRAVIEQTPLFSLICEVKVGCPSGQVAVY
jgi:hypothetical protein